MTGDWLLDTQYSCNTYSPVSLRLRDAQRNQLEDQCYKREWNDIFLVLDVALSVFLSGIVQTKETSSRDANEDDAVGERATPERGRRRAAETTHRRIAVTKPASRTNTSRTNAA